MKRIDVLLGDDPGSEKIRKMADSKKLPVRYVSEWALKDMKNKLVGQVEKLRGGDE